jgi:hypothetical protein
MRRLIIGDIHGCYDELLRLIDKAQLSDDDEIVALGDIADRGPDISKVINFFNSRIHARVVMGNHEHKHLLCQKGVIQPDAAQQITRDWLSLEGYQDFLDTIRCYPLYLDVADALLIHGALEPGVPISDQKKTVLLGTRNGEGYLRKHYPKPWYELYNGEEPVIAAHHDYSGKGEVLVIRERVFLIDTGCCYGKYLSGILLPDFQIIQVKSRKNYWAIIKQQYLHEKRVAGKSPKAIEKILLNILKSKNVFREDEPGSLLEALGDIEPHVRRAAAKVLSQQGDRRWLDLVRGDDDDIIRMGDCDLSEAVPALIYAMGWREHLFRTLAITKLGHMDAPGIVAQLGRALHHQSCRIRKGAAEALGYRLDPEAVDLLLSALDHGDAEVVTEAADGLAAFDDPRIPAAMEALRQRCPRGVDMAVVERTLKRLS